MSVYEINCSTGEAVARPMTPDELAAFEAAQAEANAAATVAAWEAVRSERNARLTACDWITSPPADYLATLGAERGAPFADDWNTYRQALRDIPQTFADPSLVEWPTPPPEPQLILT